MAKALLPLLLIGCVALIVLLQFGFLFLLLAMLPALVAFFIDRDSGRPTFKIVCACNIAATLPSLSPMLRSSLHFKVYDIAPVMGDPMVWLFVYGGAAAGWCLMYLSRFIARFILTLIYEYNIRVLEHTQQGLVEEWGQQVRQL